jgi:uncharacterized protein
LTNPNVPPMKPMLRLTVIVKSRDTHKGKPMVDALLTLLKDGGVAGATVVHGTRGYGLRGVSRADILGMSINLPVLILTVAEREKLEPILTDVKRIVGDDGIITLEEVKVL